MVSPSCVLQAIVASQWVSTIWHAYLTWRQFSLHKATLKRPAEVAEIIEEEQYNNARVYSTDRLSFKIFNGFFDVMITTCMLLGGYYAKMWALSEGISEAGAIPVFIVLISLVSLVLELPLSLYENFIIEELHGFNKYTLGFYLIDKVKKMVLSWVLMAPIGMGAAWLIDHSGEYFFVYLWLFISTILLVMMTIYPAFIAPLFDTYIPLPDGELKTAIEALASSLNYPLKKLYVVDGSKRSAHSNAYMYGFWKNKRIVLYDTLLSGEEKKKVHEAMGRDPAEHKEDGKGMQLKEVVAVLGHELGHWAEFHTVWQLLIAEANILLAFFVFSRVHHSEAFAAAFGLETPMNSFLSLLLVMQYVVGVYSEVFELFSVYVTRKMEFSADAYAARLGKANELGSALIKLSTDNLSLPINDSLYSWCTFTHPPVPERIAALKKFK